MKAKHERLTWKAVRKICKLKREEIDLAKALFFQPQGRLQFLPDRQHKNPWTVGDWIRWLYREEYGALPAEPFPELSEEEAARQFEETMFWENYRERNAE